MIPTDMSRYLNSKLLLRTSAHAGFFKLSRIIMSSCVSKVTELETKLKTSLAAMLQASIQNKITPILLHIYIYIYQLHLHSWKNPFPVYIQSMSLQMRFLIKIGISKPPTD